MNKTIIDLSDPARRPNTGAHHGDSAHPAPPVATIHRTQRIANSVCVQEIPLYLNCVMGLLWLISMKRVEMCPLSYDSSRSAEMWQSESRPRWPLPLVHTPDRLFFVFTAPQGDYLFVNIRTAMSTDHRYCRTGVNQMAAGN